MQQAQQTKVEDQHEAKMCFVEALCFTSRTDLLVCSLLLHSALQPTLNTVSELVFASSLASTLSWSLLLLLRPLLCIKTKNASIALFFFTYLLSPPPASSLLLLLYPSFFPFFLCWLPQITYSELQRQQHPRNMTAETAKPICKIMSNRGLSLQCHPQRRERFHSVLHYRQRRSKKWYLICTDLKMIGLFMGNPQSQSSRSPN